MIAIIAALPREIALLVRGVAAEPTMKARGIFLYRLPGAVVVAAGMGPARVMLAVEAATSAAPVDKLLSVGLAGACDPKLQAGDVVRAGVVIEATTGERFEDPSGKLTVVTVADVAGVAEKRRLLLTYGASVVDMEAATVARLARARGLEFGTVKVVSDASDFELPSLGRFTTDAGQIREAAFGAYVAVRPWMWRKTIELGRNSGVAVRALEQALRPLVEG